VLPGVVGQVDQAVQRALDQIFGVPDADVVDQYVDAAEHVEGSGDQAVRTVRCGQIDNDRYRIGFLESSGDRPGAGDHLHPFGQQDTHDRQADTLAAAGDDGGLAGQLQIHGFSFCLNGFALCRVGACRVR
jgi:hypothetical protein